MCDGCVYASVCVWPWVWLCVRLTRVSVCFCRSMARTETQRHTYTEAHTHKIKLFHKCHSKDILKTLTASRLAMGQAYIHKDMGTGTSMDRFAPLCSGSGSGSARLSHAVDVVGSLRQLRLPGQLLKCHRYFVE